MNHSGLPDINIFLDLNLHQFLRPFNSELLLLGGCPKSCYVEKVRRQLNRSEERTSVLVIYIARIIHSVLSEMKYLGHRMIARGSIRVLLN